LDENPKYLKSMLNFTFACSYMFSKYAKIISNIRSCAFSDIRSVY